MEKIGGLIRNMPQTALLFLAGAMAIGGLPPFNGNDGKNLIYLYMTQIWTGLFIQDKVILSPLTRCHQRESFIIRTGITDLS
jgi:formate hydrogenlyase subunit 3/multisubunit Na+/H+ antiporter MnhD subunit